MHEWLNRWSGSSQEVYAVLLTVPGPARSTPTLFGYQWSMLNKEKLHESVNDTAQHSASVAKVCLFDKVQSTWKEMGRECEVCFQE